MIVFSYSSNLSSFFLDVNDPVPWKCRDKSEFQVHEKETYDFQITIQTICSFKIEIFFFP